MYYFIATCTKFDIFNCFLTLRMHRKLWLTRRCHTSSTVGGGSTGRASTSLMTSSSFTTGLTTASRRSLLVFDRHLSTSTSSSVHAYTLACKPEVCRNYGLFYYHSHIVIPIPIPNHTYFRSHPHRILESNSRSFLWKVPRLINCNSHNSSTVTEAGRCTDCTLHVPTWKFQHSVWWSE